MPQAGGAGSGAQTQLAFGPLWRWLVKPLTVLLFSPPFSASSKLEPRVDCEIRRFQVAVCCWRVLSCPPADTELQVPASPSLHTSLSGSHLGAPCALAAAAVLNLSPPFPLSASANVV